MSKSLKEPKIEDLITSLTTEINKVSNKLGSNLLYRSVTKRRAYTSTLLDNYGEIIVISQRMIRTFNDLFETRNLLFNSEPEIPEAESKRLYEEYRYHNSLIVVDIKSLYLWTAIIQEIYRECRVKIDLSELDRISLVRHKFFVHVTKNDKYFKKELQLGKSMYMNPEKQTVAIVLTPLLSKKRKFSGLKKIVKMAQPYLPELIKEKNSYQQIFYLYEHLNKIPDRKVQRKAKEFIMMIGPLTDSPTVILLALLKALKSYRILF